MSQPDALALLDLEGSERFAFPGGDLLSAVDLPYEALIEALTDDRTFVRTVAGGRSMALRDIARLRRLWVTQQGLVDGDDLARLLWILRTFRAHVEYDLQHVLGVSLSDLWQHRQWRRLLNLIDHLPRTTWTQSAMVNHPDYAERIAEAMARQRLALAEDDEPSTPLTEWTPEVSLLATLVDAVNALRTTLIATNLDKGKQPPKIPSYPRPRTLVSSMVDKKERALAWAAHERIASQLLPKK